MMLIINTYKDLFTYPDKKLVLLGTRDCGAVASTRGCTTTLSHSSPQHCTLLLVFAGNSPSSNGLYFWDTTLACLPVLCCATMKVKVNRMLRAFEIAHELVTDSSKLRHPRSCESVRNIGVNLTHGITHNTTGS